MQFLSTDFLPNGGLGKTLDAVAYYGWRIAIIVLTAVLLNWLIRRVIKRSVRSLQGDTVQRGLKLLRKKTPNIFLETDESITLRRAQRAETIGVILRSAAAVVIFLVAFFSIMGVMHVRLAPLVAGTTVLTAVLGFGAQNIVRDFLAGFFIVVEDQYGVGDYIDVGSASGTVESVSLRITRLRNADGTLWQIPNGEIKKVGNKSQKWSRALVEFRVNLNTDTDRVEEIAKRVATDIQQDPVFGSAVVDEPEIWGPDAVDGDGMLYKIAIKTRPLEQWRISRAIRTRIKAAFDAEGIRIASAMPDIYGRSEPIPTTDEPTPTADNRSGSR